MADIGMPGSMSRDVERNHGSTTNPTARRKGRNRYLRPTAIASHLSLPKLVLLKRRSATFPMGNASVRVVRVASPLRAFRLPASAGDWSF